PPDPAAVLTEPGHTSRTLPVVIAEPDPATQPDCQHGCPRTSSFDKLRMRSSGASETQASRSPPRARGFSRPHGELVEPRGRATTLRFPLTITATRPQPQ